VVGTLVFQIVIVQCFQIVFSCVPLNVHQWIFCIVIGMLEIFVGLIVTSIPNALCLFPMDKMCSKQPEANNNTLPDIGQDEPAANRAQIMWFRGLNRIQQQIRVINAFRSSLYEGPGGMRPHTIATMHRRRTHPHEFDDITGQKFGQMNISSNNNVGLDQEINEEPNGISLIEIEVITKDSELSQSLTSAKPVYESSSLLEK
jgi:hypothetical protein